MEFQRTIIWVIFAFSLALLWDRWEVAHGGRAMFLPALVPAPAGSVSAGDGGAAPPPAGAAGVSSAGNPVATANPAPAAPAAGASAGVAAAPTAPALRASPAAELVHVDTDLLRLDIDAQGAMLVRAELVKEDVSADWTAEGLAGFITRTPVKPSEHIVLFDRSASRDYYAESWVFVDFKGVDPAQAPNLRNLRYTPLPGARSLGADQQELSVGFEGEAGGVRVRKTYVFRRGHYDVQVRHEVRNLGTEPLAPALYVEIARDNGGTEGESRFYKTYTGPAVYTDGEHYHKVSFDDIAKKDAFTPKPADNGWVGMVQHYFLSAWIPPPGAQRVFYTQALSDKMYAIGTKLPLGELAPGAQTVQQDTLYVGPQDQLELDKLAPGLDRVADYGWLDPIAKPLFWLLGFLYRLVGNWGWAIVLLTILVKLALYPLAAAGFKSMARMKEMAPRLQALKERYGENKQELQQAMMELYKKEKINPVGGCLPIVVQIPVFIALYWVLLGSVEMRNSPWILWIHDLASPDPWFVLPTLMMITSWIQFKLQPTPPDPVQAKMMMIMPLVFGVMFFFFPAGLVLYYVLNNGLSMLQQWRINQLVARSKKIG